jgi:type I restriction enzyme S subunit
MLKQIEQEEQQLFNDGKIEKYKSASNLAMEEAPYKIPKEWEWVVVKSVFDTISGTTFDASKEKQNGAYAYVKVSDMNLPGNEFIITTSSRFVDPDEKMLHSLIPADSIIFPKRGGAIATNKKKVVQKPIFVDLNIMAITPKKIVLTTYAYRWLMTIDLASLNSGTSVPQINHKDINPLLFP